MKRLIKHKGSPEVGALALPEKETDLTGLVNKMCEQLAVLEKKVDTLISHFQKPESRFRRDDRARERNFTKAVCSECGKDCEIPFKPTGDRPVYCRDCFSARNDSKSFKVKFGDRPREESSSRPRKFDNRAEPRGQGFGRKKGSFFQRRKR